jgi:hypothetical protein
MAASTNWKIAHDRPLPLNSVEKLDAQSCASRVEEIDLSDRARIDDRDHGKGEGTPKEVPRTECIEFFNGIAALPS